MATAGHSCPVIKHSAMNGTLQHLEIKQPPHNLYDFIHTLQPSSLFLFRKFLGGIYISKNSFIPNEKFMNYLSMHGYKYICHLFIPKNATTWKMNGHHREWEFWESTKIWYAFFSLEKMKSIVFPQKKKKEKIGYLLIKLESHVHRYICFEKKRIRKTFQQDELRERELPSGRFLIPCCFSPSLYFTFREC